VTKAKANLFVSMSIGQRIKWLIDHRGYTQVEVAEKCSVTQAAISNLTTDNSRKPNAFTLLALANALDADPSWILTGEGPYEKRLPSDRPDEAALLRKYRSMDEQARAGLLNLLGIKV